MTSSDVCNDPTGGILGLTSNNRTGWLPPTVWVLCAVDAAVSPSWARARALTQVMLLPVSISP